MNRLLVTIDGPAGVGKSTMARQLADALGVAYLDTGAMFRAVAWKLGEGAWDRPEVELAEELSGMRFTLSGAGAGSTLSLNGVPLGDEIRTEQVGMWGSNVARLPVVRTYLKQAQQDIGDETSLVAEGRDMGTVVFPDAEHKFFLDADVDERARRRMKQLEALGKPADFDELAQAIAARDQQDRNRAVAPLKPAEDATMVDTTNLQKNEVFQMLLEKVRG